MKNLVRAGAVLVAVLALSGCSPIRSGYITEKVHTEGYYTTTPVCVSYDPDDFHCTLYIPQITYHPPTWRFNLQYNEEEGWVYVTEGVYNSYSVGNYYYGEED